jgi:hypothetical protein
MAARLREVVLGPTSSIQSILLSEQAGNRV